MDRELIVEIVELAQSGVNIDEFYDYDNSYSGDLCDLEDIFIEATAKNKPLILRHYMHRSGGLGRNSDNPGLFTTSYAQHEPPDTVSNPK